MFTLQNEWNRPIDQKSGQTSLRRLISSSKYKLYEYILNDVTQCNNDNRTQLKLLTLYGNRQYEATCCDPPPPFFHRTNMANLSLIQNRTY